MTNLAMLRMQLAACAAHMHAVMASIDVELGQAQQMGPEPGSCPKCGASEELVEDTSTFGQKSSRCMKCGHEWGR